MRASERHFLVILLLILLVSPTIALADFVSGSTGADGAFEPTANTVLQLPESGVFNFTTVTIPAGITVTFKKNTHNTPVTILATGDVAVNGTINLDGTGSNAYVLPGAGGPGGFDGGGGGMISQSGKSGGGPGGGRGGGPATSTVRILGGYGGSAGYFQSGPEGGSYGNAGIGGSGGSIYGNERILPAIGGSGGGGGGGTTATSAGAGAGGAGGGGGGSLLIASSGIIAINGSITANGGIGSNGQIWGGKGGAGSGGSIRLLANTLSGNGMLSAVGGLIASTTTAPAGSVGRIRIEAATVLRTASTTPPASLSYPYAVTPPDMPSLKITSIGGISVPEVPAGSYSSPDVILPFNTQNPISVTVTTANIPAGQTVTVTALSAGGPSSSATGALSGTQDSSSMDASLNISLAYPFLITATVTYDLAAMNIEDFYIDGEKVEKVKVAANLGGASSVTYITASGKEIPATL